VKPCVCRVIRLAPPMEDEEMITYTVLCKHGAHWWYAFRGNYPRHYQRAGTQLLTKRRR
jgi:hypothetical protein